MLLDFNRLRGFCCNSFTLSSMTISFITNIIEEVCTIPLYLQSCNYHLWAQWGICKCIVVFNRSFILIIYINCYMI